MTITQEASNMKDRLTEQRRQADELIALVGELRAIAGTDDDAAEGE